MRKFTFLFILAIVLTACQNKTKGTKLIPAQVINIKQGKNELYGECFMKVIKNDIFIWNTVSKKIIHYTINGDNAILKDSFNYSKIWKKGMDDFYKDYRTNIKPNHILAYELNTVQDRVPNSGGLAQTFNLNLSVAIFEEDKDSTSKETWAGCKYYQIHYDEGTNSYQLKKIIIPSTLELVTLSNKGLLNLIDYKNGTAVCTVKKSQNKKNLVFNILPLHETKDGSLSFSAENSTFTVKNKYDTIQPNISMGNYVFAFAGPYYFNILTGQQFDLNGVLPKDIIQLYDTFINQPHSLRLFSMGMGQSESKIYGSTANDSTLYVFSIDKITGKGSFIKQIKIDAIQHGHSPSGLTFDYKGRLVILDVANGSIKYYEF